jgi:VanZ family protein
LERKYYIFATILWVLIVTTLSLISFNSATFNTFQNSDKFVHFFFYFVLTILLFKSFPNKVKRKHLIIIILAVLYGIVIEVFQENLTITRKLDIMDIFANTLGVISALLFVKYFVSFISFIKIKKD